MTLYFRLQLVESHVFASCPRVVFGHSPVVQGVDKGLKPSTLCPIGSHHAPLLLPRARFDYFPLVRGAEEDYLANPDNLRCQINYVLFTHVMQ